MQRLGVAEAVETPMADFALGLEPLESPGGCFEIGDSEPIAIGVLLERERIVDIKEIESLQLQALQAEFGGGGDGCFEVFEVGAF